LEAIRRNDYQQYVDMYHESGEVPPQLARFARKYEASHFERHGNRHDVGLTNLLTRARQAGIRVVGIDDAAARQDRTSPTFGSDRVRKMNILAEAIIRRDRVGQEGKYIVLVGRKHANTHAYEYVGPYDARVPAGIPGLAQLLNVPAVSVSEGRGLLQ